LTQSPAKNTKVDKRIIALLNRIAGDGEAHGLLARLLDHAEPPTQVAESIAASAGFERLYKSVRTRDIGVEGPKDANPVFVGLTELPSGLSFEEQFKQLFHPRLGKRADGFGVIFDELLKSKGEVVIVETGCMRIPCNWEGDGQSTFMFDALVQDRGGLFFSIDIALQSIDTARLACSSMTQLIFNNSVPTLHALNRVTPLKASLLYLDSFDFDMNNPLPSAIHHSLELTAAGSLIGPGTIVCVDDYALGSDGGKGMILDKFFSSIRAEVLHCGYQKVWRAP
jgi:hypothetical protein